MRAARAGRIVVAAGLAAAASGCVAWRTESVPPRLLLQAHNVHAVRIIRPDKSKIEIYDPAIVGDSIAGHVTERAIARVYVPLSHVQTIQTRHTSLGKTLLAVLGVGAGVAAYGLLQSLNQGQ